MIGPRPDLTTLPTAALHGMFQSREADADSRQPRVARLCLPSRDGTGSRKVAPIWDQQLSLSSTWTDHKANQDAAASADIFARSEVLGGGHSPRPAGAIGSAVPPQSSPPSTAPTVAVARPSLTRRTFRRDFLVGFPMNRTSCRRCLGPGSPRRTPQPLGTGERAVDASWPAYALDDEDEDGTASPRLLQPLTAALRVDMQPRTPDPSALHRRDTQPR